MNLETIIVGLINAILCVLAMIYMGNEIYNKQINYRKISNIIVIIIYGIYLGLNQYIDAKLLKVILAYTMLMGFHKIVYKEGYNKVILCSFLVYIIIYVSEIIVGIVTALISSITKVEYFIELKHLICMIIAVIVMMIIIFKIFKKKIKYIADQSDQYKTQSSIIVYVILLITTTMIVNNMYKINWTVNYELIVNIIVFAAFLGISLYIAKQNEVYAAMKNKYSELSTYSKINDELLEEYRVKSQEFNNQLAIIKSMTDEKNKELQEYLNTLIKKNKNNKYSWVNEVKYIQLAGLKGLINYKIMEMKSLNLDLKLNISKDIKKFDFKNFSLESQDHLYSIIGVYLDNAKEAALGSKDKVVIIDIYMEKEEMVVTIGNTYSGEINLEKIGEYNYSTKGKSRGVGLHLVKNIIKSDSKFSSRSEIRDEFFLQILTIKK